MRGSRDDVTDVQRREDQLLDAIGALVQERNDLLELIKQTELERDSAVTECALYRTYVTALNTNPSHV